MSETPAASGSQPDLAQKVSDPDNLASSDQDNLTPKASDSDNLEAKTSDQDNLTAKSSEQDNLTPKEQDFLKAKSYLLTASTNTGLNLWV